MSDKSLESERDFDWIKTYGIDKKNIQEVASKKWNRRRKDELGEKET